MFFSVWRINLPSSSGRSLPTNISHERSPFGLSTIHASNPIFPISLDNCRPACSLILTVPSFGISLSPGPINLRSSTYAKSLPSFNELSQRFSIMHTSEPGSIKAIPSFPFSLAANLINFSFTKFTLFF